MLNQAALMTLLCLGAVPCAGQEPVLHSKAELVLVPVSITDRHGNYVRDLEVQDLALYDNNVPQRVQIEDITLPISLAIVVQATPAAQIVLNKLRKVTGVIGPMIMGGNGEAGLVVFGGSHDQVRIIQPMTSDENQVAGAIRRLDSIGEGGSIAEAVTQALGLLAARPAGRRRVLLLISEKHDMASNAAQVSAAVSLAQRESVTIYSITFSPTAATWTNRIPKYCDRKCRVCDRTCGNCGNQCDREDGKPQPWVPGQAGNTMNLGALLGEMKKMSQVNAGDLLAKYTGGEQTAFATKSGLDGVLERIGQDVHGQYLLSFTPARINPGEFHKLRVEAKGRPDLVLRFRPGYWAAAD